MFVKKIWHHLRYLLSFISGDISGETMFFHSLACSLPQYFKSFCLHRKNSRSWYPRNPNVRDLSPWRATFNVLTFLKSISLKLGFLFHFVSVVRLSYLFYYWIIMFVTINSCIWITAFYGFFFHISHKHLLI